MTGERVGFLAEAQDSSLAAHFLRRKLMKILKTLIPISYLVIGMLASYKLGKTQAALNVHAYDSISPSIILACTEMIDEEPLNHVQDHIEIYYLLRQTLGEK